MVVVQIEQSTGYIQRYPQRGGAEDIGCVQTSHQQSFRIQYPALQRGEPRRRLRSQPRPLVRLRPLIARDEIAVQRAPVRAVGAVAATGVEHVRIEDDHRARRRLDDHLVRVLVARILRGVEGLVRAGGHRLAALKVWHVVLWSAWPAVRARHQSGGAGLAGPVVEAPDRVHHIERPRPLGQIWREVALPAPPVAVQPLRAVRGRVARGCDESDRRQRVRVRDTHTRAHAHARTHTHMHRHTHVHTHMRTQSE